MIIGEKVHSMSHCTCIKIYCEVENERESDIVLQVEVLYILLHVHLLLKWKTKKHFGLY